MGYSPQGHKESGTTERLSTALPPPPMPLIAAKTTWTGLDGQTPASSYPSVCIGKFSVCLFFYD